MEYHGILDGDYILVQRFRDSETPRDNEMIVTWYLPLEAEQDVIWNAVDNISEQSLEGSTVKFCFRIDEQKGFPFYRLSHRRDSRTSPYSIKTHLFDRWAE
jgi:hypothetical protein